MNKSEVIDAVAESADVPKTVAVRAVEAMTQVITTALKNGEDVSLIGFGTFRVKQRAARLGRNPRTGSTIEIKASKLPVFKPGKALKDAVS